MGLGYWQSLDFVDPLSLTSWLNFYVFIMIEHFSKWLELVPLPDHSNEDIAYAFLNKVLSRFGVPTEVLTNQGMEFRGDF
jgi:hypothetical protein